MAEREIRLLRSQVKEERVKGLKGLTRSSRRGAIGPEVEGGEDAIELSDEDVAEIMLENTKASHGKSHYPCEVGKHTKHRKTRSLTQKSAEKLLYASLQSLDSLGRHLEEDKRYVSSSAGGTFPRDASEPRQYPNADFLRGAVWLGRNFTMITEDMAEAMGAYRSKYLREITSASDDTDLKRGNNRLSLLAGSAVSEAVSLCENSRVKARDMVKVI